MAHQKCPGIRGRKQGRNLERQWRANLSMFLGREGKGDGFIAGPLRVDKPPAAPLGARRFSAYLQSERRRIVAQVRREVPKNQDFFAVRDSVTSGAIC
jgi:hypothetical protein